jgi:hypothetical protein
MKKELAVNLFKIANHLDSQGFIKEANSLDKIARKIVISIEYNTDSTGNYNSDIKNYQDMVEAKKNERGFGATLIDNQMNAFIDQIKVNYKSPQKEAFLLQAKNIKHSLENNLDTQQLNTKLYSLLRSKGIVDKTTNKLVFTNRGMFRSKWIGLIQPEFNLTNNAEAQWLTNKYNLLALQCK